MSEAIMIDRSSVGKVYAIISQGRNCFISVLAAYDEGLEVLWHGALGVGHGFIRNPYLPVTLGASSKIRDTRGWDEDLAVESIQDITACLAGYPLCHLGIPGQQISTDSVGRIFQLWKGHYTRGEIDYLSVEGVNEYGALVVSSHGPGCIYKGYLYPKYLPIREGRAYPGVGYEADPARQNGMSGPSGLLWKIVDITDQLENYPQCKLTKEG